MASFWVDDIFGHKNEPLNISSSFTQPLFGTITSLPWFETRIAVDGNFVATFFMAKLSATLLRCGSLPELTLIV
jgi:hypothetical protein